MADQPATVDVNVYVGILKEEGHRLQDENLELRAIVATLEAKVASLESVPVNGDQYPDGDDEAP